MHFTDSYSATSAVSTNNVRRLSSDSIPVAGLDRLVRRFPWVACAGAFSIGVLAAFWLE